MLVRIQLGEGIVTHTLKLCPGRRIKAVSQIGKLEANLSVLNFSCAELVVKIEFVPVICIRPELFLNIDPQ